MRISYHAFNAHYALPFGIAGYDCRDAQCAIRNEYATRHTPYLWSPNLGTQRRTTATTTSTTASAMLPRPIARPVASPRTT